MWGWATAVSSNSAAPGCRRGPRTRGIQPAVREELSRRAPVIPPDSILIAWSSHSLYEKLSSVCRKGIRKDAFFIELVMKRLTVLIEREPSFGGLGFLDLSGGHGHGSGLLCHGDRLVEPPG